VAHGGWFDHSMAEKIKNKTKQKIKYKKSRVLALEDGLTIHLFFFLMKIIYFLLRMGG
jgi:hypothetical protein